MKYEIRKAKREDLLRVIELYAHARSFMKEHGNPGQWGDGYPPETLICHDIDRESLYVVLDEDGIHGVFYFAVEDDPTYERIFDGKWNSIAPYGVIHRVAGDGSGGILGSAVSFAREKIRHLRIDTHEDNYVMQRALERLGFSRCGIICVEDGTPRIAFELTE